MATIKYHNNDGTWVSLYTDAIKNRLRKDKNLSDLLDKAEARKNLELTGDNNHTHYHDDRYLPKIEKVSQDCTAAIKVETSERHNEISNEASERHNEIVNEATERDKRIAQEKQERVVADNELRELISKEVNDRTSAITNLKNYVDNKSCFDSRGRLIFPNGNLLWIE